MSSFTVPTPRAIKHLGASYTFQADGRIVVSGDIGLSTYQALNTEYRKSLNSKILRRYWYHEIGVETAEMWKFNMESDMLEMMPYYNQLIASTQLQFDPMRTIDITTVMTGSLEHEGSREESTESVNSTEGKSRAVNSETPQMMLAGNADYARAAADSASQSLATSDIDGEATDRSSDSTESETSVKGYQGIPSDLLLAYRQTLINIDSMIVDALSSNFLQIYASGSSFSDSGTYERYMP